MASQTPHNSPGSAWLATHARRPDIASAVWDLDGLAPIHCTTWLAAEIQLNISLDALGRLRRGHRGPLLLDPALDTAWWLVPHSAALELADIRSVTVHPQEWPLHVPPVEHPAAGRFWHIPPDGSGHLTEPAYLAAALGPVGRLPAEAF
ncbi:hypothetical protein ACFVTY_08910 [Streptomyces sp. NPDC058067]|uniref:hypothetical protein n=1 Tax=Streptomyces sp. NPDC058067 TaxID=3346324 RepID=UPI0036EAEC49